MEYTWKLLSSISSEEREKARSLNISPISLQILKNRGIVEVEDIEDFIYSKAPPLSKSDPYLLKDIDKAMERILKAIDSLENIVIYGDYDADGITGSALLHLFFVVYSYYNKISIKSKVILPDRLTSGYGLKEGGVDKARELNAKLIITVDNGTSSLCAVDYANKLNIDVIIIDHHSIPPSLPLAYAIINPKQKDCLYPYKDFSAVALVYKLTVLLSERLLGENERKLFLRRYIDLVAIGTYQDLAPLRGENRYFLKEGLKVLQDINSLGNTNLVGICELLRASGIENNATLTEDTIGFVIGPLINAAGRIASPSLAFNLLTTRDKKQARDIALNLIEINSKRKEMTNKAFLEARSYIEKEGLLSKKVILLISDEWHQGIIGLIAQRVADFYKRNCIVMSRSQDIYIGSARSYGLFNMGDLVSNLREYFIYSGGHSKAAGFSIKEDRLDAFKKALYEMEGKIELISSEELKIDSSISLDDLNISFIDEFAQLKPFGKGNPKPIFSIHNVLIQQIRASARGLDTLVKVFQNKKSFSFVAFNETKYIVHFKKKDRIDIAFNLYKDKDFITASIIDIKHTL